MKSGRLRLVSGARSWDAVVGRDASVAVDGRAYRVEPGPGGVWRIDAGDRQWLAHVVSDGTRLWVHAEGDVHVFEVETGDEREPRARPAGADALSAPMPATVRDVHVAPGDEVARGDVLLTLEAMKMELPLRAPHAGVVRAVHCARGELVQPGVTLVEIA